MTPTLELYSTLQAAFDHFNKTLFGGVLPQCIMTLRSSNRAYGYMHSRRFVSIDGRQIDELGINPGYFGIQSSEEVMATIVHEMVHHWQNHFGSPSKSIPHNKEWADKMETLGLMPSDTGLPGGKRTGRTMSDYIIPGGLFVSACQILESRDAGLPWFDRHLPVSPDQMAARRDELHRSGHAFVGQVPPIQKAIAESVKLDLQIPVKHPSIQRIRQICPSCAVRAWTAPQVVINCGVCDVVMQAG